MKKLMRLVCMSIIGLAAVSCYHDSKIWETMEDYEARLAELETLCSTMNTNISSLQTLVEAVKASDYITKVEPLTENDKEVGYTITFAKLGTVKVYHGKDGVDGADGTTPVVGVKQDTDKEWYWTINGEWLTGNDGKKVKATGSDGADGQNGAMPTLKIEDDYWYVSYDGRTWTRLDKATGEDGQDGKDGKNGSNGIFQNVYPEGGYLFFVLADNTTYKVPLDASALSAASSLDIQFDVEQGVKMVPGATYKVKYTVTGGNQNTVVRVGTCEGSPVIAAVKPETATSGYIYIHIEEWFDGSYDSDRNESNYDQHDYDDTLDEITQEEVYHSRMYLMVSVSDGGNNVINKTLNINEGIIEGYTDTYLNEPTACQTTITVQTNVNYQVYIPEDITWVSYTPTRSDLRTDELVLSLEANDTDLTRFAEIHLINEAGSKLESFTIGQKSGKWDEAIEFADSEMERLCLEAYDWDGDGRFTYGEAHQVYDIWSLRYMDKANVTSFDELQYFTSVTEIPYEFFDGCYNLRSVKLPSSITYIHNYAFRGTSIETIEIPALVSDLCHESFKNCWNLKSVKMASTEPCYIDNAFDLHTIISVPDGCYQAYKDKWGFYNFAEQDLYIYTYRPSLNEVLLSKGEDGWYTAQLDIVAGDMWRIMVDWHDLYLYNTTYPYPDTGYQLSREYYNSYFPGTGTVTVYISEDLQTFKYEGDITIELHPEWYLVGSFNEWEPGVATFKMSKEGEWFVYRSFASAGTEMKFVGTSWDVNRGGTFYEVGSEITMHANGDNIQVPEGVYDIYLSADASVAVFQPAENPIGIDGLFTDWDLIDESKISVATCDPEAYYTALKTVKVYTVADYINIYFEFDEEQIIDREWVPFHVYINQDNNTEGCGDDQWLGQGGQDWLMEGAVLAESAFCSYNPGLFKYIGADPATVEWAWESLLPEGSGIATGAGSGNKYELSIIKEMIPGLDLADPFGIGVDILQEWSPVGLLPNTATSQDNPQGAAPMLEVYTNK